MTRTRGVFGTLVVLLGAIFTVPTPQVMSWPAKAVQTARDGKPDGATVEKLLADSDCRSCHAADRKVVGPSYGDIAKRYASQADAAEKLAQTVRQGGSGNWGNVAMTPHPDLKDES